MCAVFCEGGIDDERTLSKFFYYDVAEDMCYCPFMCYLRDTQEEGHIAGSLEECEKLKEVLAMNPELEKAINAGG